MNHRPSQVPCLANGSGRSLSEQLRFVSACVSQARRPSTSEHQALAGASVSPATSLQRVLTAQNDRVLSSLARSGSISPPLGGAAVSARNTTSESDLQTELWQTSRQILLNSRVIDRVLQAQEGQASAATRVPTASFPALRLQHSPVRRTSNVDSPLLKELLGLPNHVLMGLLSSSDLQAPSLLQVQAPSATNGQGFASSDKAHLPALPAGHSQDINELVRNLLESGQTQPCSVSDQSELLTNAPASSARSRARPSIGGNKATTAALLQRTAGLKPEQLVALFKSRTSPEGRPQVVTKTPSRPLNSGDLMTLIKGTADTQRRVAETSSSLRGDLMATLLAGVATDSKPPPPPQAPKRASSCGFQPEEAAALLRLQQQFAPLPETTTKAVEHVAMTKATFRQAVKSGSPVLPEGSHFLVEMCRGPEVATTRVEVPTPESSLQVFIPLGIEQDINWLSECQCMLRADFIEVTQASRKEFKSEGNGPSLEYQQVGIRCRYCAHLPSGQRPSRSSAFPSSTKQLYQSFTMMQRDHFHKCASIPLEKRQRLEELRKSNTQGACDSKQYWIYAAQTLGMFDTHRGIEITSESRAAGRKLPNFGISKDEERKPPALLPLNPAARLLVFPSDAQRLHPFLFSLLHQLQLVELLPFEQQGKRKGLPIGFCGLGCRYCCPRGRMGFSRTYPLRRRTLQVKLDDMFTHLLRCSLCPKGVKSQLMLLAGDDRKTAYQNQELLDRIWKQLGREGDFAS